MLEKVHIASWHGVLVAARESIVLNRNGKVAGAKKRAHGDRVDNGAIGHPDGQQLALNTAGAVHNSGHGYNGKGSSGQGRDDDLINGESAHACRQGKRLPGTVVAGGDAG